MVEPSGFRTDWAGSSMDRAEPIDAYQGIETIAKRCSRPSTVMTRLSGYCSETSLTTWRLIAINRGSRDSARGNGSPGAPTTASG